MGDFIGPVIPGHLKENANQNEEDEESGVIGPALPPGWKRDEDISSDFGMSDKVIGPILPPNFAKKRPLDDDDNIEGPVKSNKSKGLGPKVIGPTLPSDFINKPSSTLSSETSSNQLISCDESSNDEDDEFTIGPLPPSGNFIEVEESRHSKSQQVASGSKGPQREEWIARLPENSSVAHKLGFGKSMTSFSSKPVSIKEITPVDHDNELDKAVDEFNKTTRPEALVDLHKKKMKHKKKEKDEAPTRQLFDFNPEEDLKLRQLDSKQTKSIMEKAKLLNSRFSNPRGQNKFL
ncbi:GPALPP motifs-containing protein 1-like [Panonychus citri]|uniref:GPALPP motifs-containing protein 1-like n=1 Tax=Panonychus citri TaxID=50023 RepID=UPI002307C70B|nr:GPALPP motifs-containing protein 1-like [Panonychus citri]